jgi:hypothetical protein
MRQPLLGEEVERQGGPRVIGNRLGLAPELGQELIRVGIRSGAQKVRWKPEIPLPLMQLHELPDPALKVSQDFDFGLELSARVGDGTHECPGTAVSPLNADRTSLIR